MKPISTYVVLAYNTGNYLPKSCSNTATYRFNVGAKSPREAEKLIVAWLKEHDLTTKTRPPRTYFLDSSLSLKYKEIQQVDMLIARGIGSLQRAVVSMERSEFKD